MKLIEAHAQLLRLGVPTFSTGEASAGLAIGRNHAAKILQRLEETGHVVKLCRGRWALPELVKPFMLPEALTAPTPSYVSLLSALYHHGMIEQIPETVYAITLGATRVVETPLGTVSLHQVTPTFFFGFEVQPGTNVKIATAEKALVDYLYLRPARSRLFRALPELELPRSFSGQRAAAMVEEIRMPSRRSLVKAALDHVVAHARAE